MIKELVSTVSNPTQSNGLRVDAGRLDSWKEIANYFRREVRTVQLWEKREGLPVHRHFHKQLGSVFAFRSELDAWNEQVSLRGGQHSGAAKQPKTSKAAQGSVPGHITIRVEPLHNQTVGEQALCGAIAAKTIAVLQQLNPGQLSVEVAPTSEKGRRTSVSEEAPQESIADYVLQWGVEDHCGGLRVHAELLLVDTTTVVWSHMYQCDRRDVDGMPGYLADQIVLCVWLKVISSPASCRFTRRNEKPGARAAYLKGRYFWKQRNEEGMRKAIQCFEAAVQEDPSFALPYSGLADSLTLLSFYEIVPPSQAMPGARRAALKAIELDPDLAEAHASLADIQFHFDRDWQGADREYRRAIQCNPGYALGYHWYANLLAAQGQHEAAHIAIMHALEIDPVSLITLVWAGVTSHMAHRFDEAIKYYKSALELDPDFVWAHMYLAQALEQNGDFKEAVREFEKTMKLSGGNNCVLAMKAHTHAVAGDTTSARQILHGLKSSANRRCMPSYDIAATHAALGETRQMAFWLNRACNERNMKVFTLMQDPRFDQLRHQAEFKEVVNQVGLTLYNPSRVALS
jgi:tetratricopeptide (TPR) repeat protein/TolB-like protein